MTKKVFSIILVVVAIMIIFTSCSAAVATRPQPAEGATTYEVTGECTAVSDGDKVIVTAKSDIAAGTNGTLSVYSAVGKELALTKVTQEKVNGEITAEFKVEDSWADDVYAFLVFDTKQSDGQPDEIKEKYGKQFENIEGENVVWSSAGIAVVFQSDVISVR